MRKLLIFFLLFLNLKKCFSISGVIWRENLKNFYPILSIKEFLDEEERFDNTSFPHINIFGSSSKAPKQQVEAANFNGSKIHLAYFEVSGTLKSTNKLFT